MGLFTLGRNGVQLVDEDNCWRVLLGLFKGLSQVGLGFSGEFRHDFRAIDQEEECSGLVGDGSGNKGLTRTYEMLKRVKVLNSMLIEYFALSS